MEQYARRSYLRSPNQAFPKDSRKRKAISLIFITPYSQIQFQLLLDLESMKIHRFHACGLSKKRKEKKKEK